MKVTKEISDKVRTEAEKPGFADTLFARLKSENPAIAGFMAATRDSHTAFNVTLVTSGHQAQTNLDGGNLAFHAIAVTYRMLELATEQAPV